jgi:predicted ArsR family transcriptional regulator
MYSIPQLHVLTILRLVKKPVTQERLTDLSEKIGYRDTPQSLRSRMVELERAGYTHRVDRNGISGHGRPCWRWQLTEKGEEYVSEILDVTTPDERK